MPERAVTTDRRLLPARADVAAAFLREQVRADRYADGVPHHVCVEVADVRRMPGPGAPLDTQLRFGQRFVVYDVADGWAWGQAKDDGYVGYVKAAELVAGVSSPTHRVEALRTFVYPRPDMKTPPRLALTLGADVVVTDAEGPWWRISAGGYVYARHLGPATAHVADFVSVAERLQGVPYLWGGASTLGIDCSGLVQLAASFAGKSLPRDTDLQEHAGDTLPHNESGEGLTRGDVVFWKGHVGVMVDDVRLIHANAHHMLVIVEPLRSVIERSLKHSVSISSVCRYF